MLTEINYLPEGLLQRQAHELNSILHGPTLIHLQGRLTQPLFVSVLVHGNETVGWDAMRQVLARYSVAGGEAQLPRSLSLFIANPAAASLGVRHLPEQPDYNRVWPGCEKTSNASTEFADERALMQLVVDKMAALDLFAAVDLHNNTGLNPHYACINRLDSSFLHLATLFSRTVVYFVNPCQVASMAMARLCPSVTLECGKVGSQQGVQHAAEFVDACLHLQALPDHEVARQDYDLFHTVAIVKIPQDVGFEFYDEETFVEATLNLPADIEYMNFRELPAGTEIARLGQHTQKPPLDVYAEDGELVTDRYFRVVNQRLLLNACVMPSMLTTNNEVIRQDCLCYLMERYPF